MTRRPVTLLAIALAAGGAAPASARGLQDDLPATVHAAAVHAAAGQSQERGRADGRREPFRDEQTDRTTRTLKLGANGELDVANISGDITVARGRGQEATIEIVKTARGRTAEDARELLGLVQVDVVERGTRAEVRARYPDGAGRRGQNRRDATVSVAYTITAPAGVRVTARSISGSVSVRDISGELALESVSGNITIANGGRVAGAKSISGNVEITGTEIDGALDASSVSGDVVLRRSTARRLNLATVSGDITMDDVDCPRVQAQTVSGNVAFSGPLSAGGRYGFTSHSGEARLQITGGTGFELDATSFSGSVRSDPPLVSQSAQTRGGRPGGRRSVRGTYGDGSAIVDVSTFSGDVLITRR